MNPPKTAAEAEAQLRALIAAADLHYAKLDEFLASLRTMRTSDLFVYLVDHTALAIASGLKENDASDEHAKLVSFAAVFALKDEIDRRFPVPEGPP